MSLDARAHARLAALRQAHLSRHCPAISDRRGVHYRLDGRPVVGFCSNDYLGLADALAVVPGPAGAGASRLVCGDLPDHRRLEARVASIVGCGDAVVFPSGFQLNVGVLPALLEPGDHVFSDALNHASLIDGLRLSAARAHILDHRQPPPPQSSRTTQRVWVTESIFSMDGDRVDLAELAAFARDGGEVYADEAHAFGLFSGGQGLLGAHGLTPTLTVATLSKSAGGAGAFVATTPAIAALLRSRCRSFVFSSGSSPVLATHLLAALEVLTSARGEALRAKLWDNANRLRTALGMPGPAPSPIVPLVVGDNMLALELAAHLLELGYHVQPIRPPTVPNGTSRLRVTVSAAHEPAEIDAFAEALRRCFAARGLTLSGPAQTSKHAPQREPAQASPSPRARSL